MSKSKKNQLVKEAINHLTKAYDIIEGLHSNIPECCIEGFLKGRTFMNVRNTLPEKEQNKLYKFHYVPCEKCLKKNKINKLKEGISLGSNLIHILVDSLRDGEK